MLMMKNTPSLISVLTLTAACCISLPSASLARERMPSQTAAPAGIIVAHLDTDTTIRGIGDTVYAARKQLTNDIEARVKATHDALTDIKISDLPVEVRSQCRAALNAEGDARSALNSRLRAARNADADNWETNRIALGATYQYYSDAATRVESFVNGGVAVTR
jgi:hypothetical protein